jgi:L-seryl-tRNA(Ser) seleniumtransferase
LETRRRFFGWVQSILAAGSVVQPGAGAVDRTSEPATDYYDKLGVTKIINAAGTYTMLTASTMPPVVQAAVAQAAKHPVRLAELQDAAGRYLAKRLQCESAMVTAGAASALTLGTAACMTMGRTGAPDLLPDRLDGVKNEVLIQKAHRYGYDHAIRNCGARFVEVETLEDYKRAFTEKTVMAHFFNAAEHGEISREDWIRVAHEHNVPCFNDAAADVPPISNLWKYTQMGFDLVTFSGGKGIRGPQNAGLLLGRKALIAAAAQNNSPFDETVGRGMKVAKEQIVGMVAAVDWFVDQSEETMQKQFMARAERISATVRTIPTLTCRIVVPPVANQVPHLLIKYDQDKVKISPKEVLIKLRQGTPSIELNPATGSNHGSAGIPADEQTIVVGVWMLEPGEDMFVGKHLHEVLAAAISA